MCLADRFRDVNNIHVDLVSRCTDRLFKYGVMIVFDFFSEQTMAMSSKIEMEVI